MGILVMILGLVLFLGPHVFVSLRGPRAALIARIGEIPYKVVFAVATLAGLYIAGKGFAAYRSAGIIEVWSPPDFMRHITILLVWPAAIFFVAPYLPGNIKRVLKHPMLVGVKLWAFGHLLSNGDLGGMILFGSVLAWAVYDRITLKRRLDPGGPEVRNGGVTYDIAAIVVGTILYMALGLVFHPLVVGLRVFGTAAFGT